MTTNADDLTTLPVVHSTDGFCAESIFTSKVLKTSFCSVFKRDLVYFFYAKPAHEVKSETDKPRSDSIYLPVCFLFDISDILIDNIFPFDSGAFVDNKFREYTHPKMNISDFSLGNTVHDIKAHITNYFGTNENYFRGLCKPSDYLPKNLLVESVLQILEAKGDIDFDLRSNTVEIVSSMPVDIDKCVKCVFLPDALMRNDAVKTFLDSHKSIDIKKYRVSYPKSPSRLTEAVFQRVADYLFEKGILASDL